MTSFLDLPYEIRYYIYELHFDTTTMSIGYGDSNITPGDKLQRPRHNLAILCACKAIYAEAKSIWISHVQFDFAKVRDMLNALAPLKMQQRSSIRYISLTNLALRLRLPTSECNRTRNHNYYVGELISLLPGLRLDMLRINAPLEIHGDTGGRRYLDPNCGHFEWCCFESMMKRPLGWKTLRLKFPASRVTRSLRAGPPWLRWVLPSDLDAVIKKQESSGSGAGVHMLLGHEILDTKNLAQRLGTGFSLLDILKAKYKGQTRPFNISKSVRDGIAIVAHRGSGKDYAIRRSSLVPSPSKRYKLVTGKNMYQVTWAKIREAEEQFAMIASQQPKVTQRWIEMLKILNETFDYSPSNSTALP